MDFHFDTTADGRRLKFLNVIDEHSRLCLAPAFIRSHNASEFIAQALRDWCEASTTSSTAYIAPGSHGRTGLPRCSTAGSGMISSTLSCHHSS